MREFREDRRPADLWFWNDWFSSFDVRSCSLAAQGLWVNMLGIMSRSETKGILSINGKPLDSKDIAKIVGVFKDEVEKLLAELEYFKVFSRLEDGTIINRRMFRESKLSQERSRAGKIGASSRWQTDSNAIATSDGKPIATLESDNEYDSSLNKNLKGVDGFDEWWSRYPRKVAKKVAARAYAAAVKAGAEPGDLLKALEGYVVDLRKKATEEKFVLHPSTFLHEDRWRDYLDRPARILQVGESPKQDHGPEYWAKVRELKAQGIEGQALNDALAAWKAKEAS